MRGFTQDQLEIIKSEDVTHHSRLEIFKDSWINLSSLDGEDRVVSWKRHEGLDSRVSTLKITLSNDSGLDSLFPGDLRSRYNQGGALLQPQRPVRFWTATTRYGESPRVSDWSLRFEGFLGDVPTRARDLISIDCRDKSERISDVVIPYPRVFGSEEGKDRGQVLQDIVDAYLPPNHGIRVFYFDGLVFEQVSETTDTGTTVVSYRQDAGISVWEALQRVADQHGWDLRYRFVPTTGGFELVFSLPNREKVNVDDILTAHEIGEDYTVTTSASRVRNTVIVDNPAMAPESIETKSAEVVFIGGTTYQIEDETQRVWDLERGMDFYGDLGIKVEVDGVPNPVVTHINPLRGSFSLDEAYPSSSVHVSAFYRPMAYVESSVDLLTHRDPNGFWEKIYYLSEEDSYLATDYDNIRDLAKFIHHDLKGMLGRVRVSLPYYPFIEIHDLYRIRARELHTVDLDVSVMDLEESGGSDQPWQSVFVGREEVIGSLNRWLLKEQREQNKRRETGLRFSSTRPSTPLIDVNETKFILDRIEQISLARGQIVWTMPDQRDIVTYELRYRKQGETAWSVMTALGLSLDVPNLDVGVYYEFGVRAFSLTGTPSLWSPSEEFYVSPDTVAPPIPSGVEIVAGTGRAVSLSWEDVEADDLDGYKIYRGLSNDWASATFIEKVASSPFVDLDVELDVEYFYWVTSVDLSKNESLPSQVQSATPKSVSSGDLEKYPPESIANAIITFQSDEIYQTDQGWNFVRSTFEISGVPSDANRAYLQVKYRQVGGESFLLGDTLESQGIFSIEGLLPNMSYEIRVEPVSHFGIFGEGVQISRTTSKDQIPPEKPSAPVVSGIIKGISVGIESPNSEPDLVAYEVHFGDSAGFTPGTLTLQDLIPAIPGEPVGKDYSNLTPGEEVWVKVIARDSSGNGSLPSEGSSGTPLYVTDDDQDPTAPADPTLDSFSVFAEETVSGVQIFCSLSFTSDPNSVLLIERRISGGDWELIGSAQASPWTDRTGLLDQVTYEYRAKAQNYRMRSSGYSNILPVPVSSPPLVPSAPGSVDLKLYRGDLLVRWEAVQGIKKYRVEFLDEEHDLMFSMEVQGTMLTYSREQNISENSPTIKEFYIRVDSINDLGISSQNPTVYTIEEEYPDTPLGFDLIPIQKGFHIDWNRETDVYGYEIQESSRVPGSSWGPWKVIARGPIEPMLFHGGLDQNLEYRFRIRALSFLGYEGPWTTSTPKSPKGISISEDIIDKVKRGDLEQELADDIADLRHTVDKNENEFFSVLTADAQQLSATYNQVYPDGTDELSTIEQNAQEIEHRVSSVQRVNVITGKFSSIPSGNTFESLEDQFGNPIDFVQLLEGKDRVFVEATVSRTFRGEKFLWEPRNVEGFWIISITSARDGRLIGSAIEDFNFYPIIVVSEDEGVTWDLLHTADSEFLEHKEVFDTPSGYITAGSYFGEGFVKYSTDGGSTWNVSWISFEESVTSITRYEDLYVMVGENWDTGDVRIWYLYENDPTTIYYASQDWYGPGILNKVRFLNDRFIAVGSNGLIMTSTNGTNWSSNHLGGSGLTSVTYGNGIYVVVGLQGRILRSIDGTNWDSVNIGESRNLWDVSYTNQGFVAAGQQGLVLISQDGLEWTNIEVDSSDALNGVYSMRDKTIVTGYLTWFEGDWEMVTEVSTHDVGEVDSYTTHVITMDRDWTPENVPEDLQEDRYTLWTLDRVVNARIRVSQENDKGTILLDADDVVVPGTIRGKHISAESIEVDNIYAGNMLGYTVSAGRITMPPERNPDGTYGAIVRLDRPYPKQYLSVVMANPSHYLMPLRYSSSADKIILLKSTSMFYEQVGYTSQGFPIQEPFDTSQEDWYLISAWPNYGAAREAGDWVEEVLIGYTTFIYAYRLIGNNAQIKNLLAFGYDPSQVPSGISVDYIITLQGEGMKMV